MGLRKLKVHINYGPQRFCQGGRKIIWRKVQGKRKIYSVSKKKSRAKEMFESIKGCKHPIIASGVTPIGSAGRSPDKIKARSKDNIFEPILKKTFDYSLGGYSHREHWSSTR
jgi:hypothetical protein